MSLTKDEIQAIRERAEAAHPGPWTHGNPTSWIWGPSEKGGHTHVADVRGWGYLTGHGHGALALAEDEALARQRATGAFIAHARSDIPALITALERAEAEHTVLMERAVRDSSRAMRAEAHAAALAGALESAVASMCRDQCQGHHRLAWGSAQRALSAYRVGMGEACSRHGDLSEEGAG